MTQFKSFQKYLLEAEEQEKFYKESSVDFPKSQSLNDEVWNVSNPAHITLRKDVKSKIFSYVSKIINYFNLPVNEGSVHICGSLTSNQYSEKTDLDVHIMAPQLDSETLDKYNSILRKLPQEIFGKDYVAPYINTHPIEFYIQNRAFQDYASVGCYSFFEDKWLVGPEVVPMDFDPHVEFNDMMFIVKKWADTLALNIERLKRKTFELEQRIGVGDESKIAFTEDKIKNLMTTIITLKDKLLKLRRDVSQPTSIEDAKKMRNSKVWKSVNALVKFLGNYGYIDKCNKIQAFYNASVKSKEHIDLDELKSLIDNL